MTVNRTTLLNLPLPVTGTESGTWGDTTNNGLTQYMDIAVAGMTSLTSSDFTAGALTLSNSTGDSSATNIAASSAQYGAIKVSSLATASTITAPSSNRRYVIINADATYNVTIKASGQTGVAVVPGEKALVAFNGTDYVKVGGAAGGSTTQIQFNNAGVFGGSANLTWDGTNVQIGATGALRLADTDSSNYVAFKSPGTVASNVTWTLPSADGTNGQALTTNGSGTLAFSSVTTSPGGSNTQIQYNNAGAFGGSSSLTWDGTNFRTAGNARIEGNGVGVTGTGAGAEIYANSGSVYFQGYNRTTSAYVPVIIGGSDTRFTTGGSEQMRIDSSGNVGIGTSSPADRLDVRQAGVAARFTSTNGNANQVALSNSATAVVGFYMGSPAADVLQFSSSAGTERARIPAAGGFQVVNCASVGNATPSTSGAGITFPATQSASSDANTLDDYEEGTWTPSLGGTATYSEQIGTYTKIGRQVTVRYRIAVSGIGTGSTTTLTGLPFTVNGSGAGALYWDTSLVAMVYCTGFASSTSIVFYRATSADFSLGTGGGIFKNGTTVDGITTYFV